MNNEIEKHFDQQDIEKDIVERSTFEEEIEEVICKINAALTRPQAQVSDATITTRPSSSTIKVKLPKLSLPYFDGNPTQWTAYWDSFQSTIHNHPELSKVDKLRYLQTSLIGDAALTIAGLQITNENYDEAIELLEKQFGNKQIIISRHIEDLMQFPKVSSNDDLRGIRILYDKLETTTRSLKSIRIKSDSYSAVISPVIMSKLPSELRLLISRELKEEWDIVGLLQRLGEEISLREKCALSSITSTSRQIDKEWRGSKASQHQPEQQPKTTTNGFYACF